MYTYIDISIVHMYICVYIHTFVYVCMYVYIHTYLYIQMSICISSRQQLRGSSWRRCANKACRRCGYRIPSKGSIRVPLRDLQHLGFGVQGSFLGFLSWVPLLGPFKGILQRDPFRFRFLASLRGILCRAPVQGSLLRYWPTQINKRGVYHAFVIFVRLVLA